MRLRGYVVMLFAGYARTHSADVGVRVAYAACHRNTEYVCLPDVADCSDGLSCTVCAFALSSFRWSRHVQSCLSIVIRLLCQLCSVMLLPTPPVLLRLRRQLIMRQCVGSGCRARAWRHACRTARAVASGARRTDGRSSSESYDGFVRDVARTMDKMYNAYALDRSGRCARRVARDGCASMRMRLPDAR